jgi:hypothetical protein
VLACLAVLGACESATYVEGVVRWESRDGRFGVEYITPPWEVASDDAAGLQLQVAAELFGVSLEGAPPTHVFTLGPVDPSAALSDLLPQGFPDVGTSTSYDLEPTGDDIEPGDATGGLLDIDLGVPQAVALVELDALVVEQRADLRRELGLLDGPGSPWMYEVVIPPGLFVRGYYYAEGDRTIRAMFASVFTLGDGDVSRMAQTITVGGP